MKPLREYASAAGGCTTQLPARAVAPGGTVYGLEPAAGRRPLGRPCRRLRKAPPRRRGRRRRRSPPAGSIW